MGDRVEERGGRGLLLRRLGWFIVLWGAGVGGLALVASLLKALMHAAGMR
jgi:Protein of unknown function (DUF2474)